MKVQCLFSWLLAASLPAAEAPWGVQVVQSPLVTERTFSAGDELSGIASLNGTDCLVVSNEARYAQTARLSREPWRLQAGDVIPLSAAAGDEMDLEAVAANPEANCYYLLGSHAVSKQKGNARPDQEQLFRVPVDAKTGRPDPNGLARVKSVSLKNLLLTVPEVKDAAGRPLQQNGLNLEGMACRNGKLLIGCRAPNREGSVPILEMDAEALFGGAAPAVSATLLPLGRGVGIRDLACVKDGVLMLTGNSGSEPSPKFPDAKNFDGDKSFSIVLWKPGAEPAIERIAAVPAAAGKAEGLLVVEESPAGILVLILFDGAYNGGPILLRLIPPARKRPGAP